MKYMMFVVVDPDAEATPREEDITIEEWLEDVETHGTRVTGDRLRPTSDATTVRISKGEVLVTDGPFTESKEWIAGFDILDCKELYEAIASGFLNGFEAGLDVGEPLLDGDVFLARGRLGVRVDDDEHHVLHGSS